MLTKGDVMEILDMVMLLVGIGLMVVNILRFRKFMKSQRDILSTSRTGIAKEEIVALVLLVLFLVGYVIVFVSGLRSIVVSSILCGGAVFVAIIENALFSQIRTIKERTFQIAEVLINVIEARDPTLNGHSLHVRNLTMLLYRNLPEKIRSQVNEVNLNFAAIMHDLGKLGVPEEILNKPSALTAQEWKIMRMHPMIGVRILSPVHAFDMIAPWIKDHHERMDGNGYYHVPGEEVPLASRMIAICDTYSVITMRRPYKEAKTHEEAIRIIKSVSGTQLDPELVRYFLTIPKEELEKCVPNSSDLQNLHELYKYISKMG